MQHRLRPLKLTVLFTLLLAPLAAAVRASADPALDRERLWKAENTWVRALESGDPALLEGLIDAEFTFIGPDGELEERAAYLAGYRALPARGVAVEKITLDEVKMRVLGETAIVTGHVVARIRVQGQPIVENVRFTRVYRRQGKDWRMVAGQGTRIAAPPAQAKPSGG